MIATDERLREAAFRAMPHCVSTASVDLVQRHRWVYDLPEAYAHLAPEDQVTVLSLLSTACHLGMAIGLEMAKAGVTDLG